MAKFFAIVSDSGWRRYPATTGNADGAPLRRGQVRCEFRRGLRGSPR